MNADGCNRGANRLVLQFPFYAQLHEHTFQWLDQFDGFGRCWLYRLRKTLDEGGIVTRARLEPGQ